MIEKVLYTVTRTTIHSTLTPKNEKHTILFLYIIIFLHYIFMLNRQSTLLYTQ